MSGASLRRSACALILAVALLAILGDWSPTQGLAGLWRVPAALLLLGLAYESWFVARSRFAFELEAPAHLYLGRPGTIRFVCRRAPSRALSLEIAPAAPSDFEIDGSIERVRLQAAQETSIMRTVTATRLGSSDWPALRARVAGPLGLAWWPRLIACPGRIVVLPDLFRSAGEVKGVAAIGARAGADIGAGTEVLRLRDYRAGDPPRVIDWKATVRADRLISREFSQDDGLQIVIVIDAGRSSALRAGSLDRFGHYVNVAARLAQFAAEREDLIGLVVYADRPAPALVAKPDQLEHAVFAAYANFRRQRRA
jgi:uncharacterized protein (DUF58 family)